MKKKEKKKKKEKNPEPSIVWNLKLKNNNKIQ